MDDNEFFEAMERFIHRHKPPKPIEKEPEKPMTANWPTDWIDPHESVATLISHVPKAAPWDGPKFREVCRVIAEGLVSDCDFNQSSKLLDQLRHNNSTMYAIVLEMVKKRRG